MYLDLEQAMLLLLEVGKLIVRPRGEQAPISEVGPAVESTGKYRA